MFIRFFQTLYTVLEQYRHYVLNSTFLSDQITPNELTPSVNRWSRNIRELGNAFGAVTGPHSIVFRVWISRRQTCITIRKIRWHMLFIFHTLTHSHIYIFLYLSRKRSHHRLIMLENTYHWLQHAEEMNQEMVEVITRKTAPDCHEARL